MAIEQDKVICELRDVFLAIQINLGAIQESLQSVNIYMEKADELFRSLQVDNASSEKLSKAAKLAIASTEGPLNPENLEKFLMEDAFGKPKPEVLPIIRKYTMRIGDLRNQLVVTKKKMKESHIHYKEYQRKLDANLERRIETLIANIDRELEIETSGGLTQTAIDMYLTRES